MSISKNVHAYGQTFEKKLKITSARKLEKCIDFSTKMHLTLDAKNCSKKEKNQEPWRKNHEKSEKLRQGIVEMKNSSSSSLRGMKNGRHFCFMKKKKKIFPTVRAWPLYY